MRYSIMVHGWGRVLAVMAVLATFAGSTMVRADSGESEAVDAALTIGKMNTPDAETVGVERLEDPWPYDHRLYRVKLRSAKDGVGSEYEVRLSKKAGRLDRRYYSVKRTVPAAEDVAPQSGCTYWTKPDFALPAAHALAKLNGELDPMTDVRRGWHSPWVTGFEVIYEDYPGESGGSVYRVYYNVHVDRACGIDSVTRVVQDISELPPNWPL